VLAFFYTWLFNRTGSVLLCILLHASFTPAQDHLLLLRDEVHGVTDLAIGLAYLGAIVALVGLTRGRLGAVVVVGAGRTSAGVGHSASVPPATACAPEPSSSAPRMAPNWSCCPADLRLISTLACVAQRRRPQA
jgi:hypothetical protein